MARDWEAVVAELVRVRGEALIRYATLVSGRRDEAADLVQDALVKTFGRLRNGYTVDNAEPYVRRAIMTLWLDRARRATRWRAIAPLEYRPDETPAPSGGVDARLDLHRELERLSPRERACLVLRYYDDLKVDDIAATLRISPGTVKRYLSDGLAKMAIALADDGTVEDRLGTAAPAASPREGRRAARREEDRRGRV
ncbi:sigma-70 family RNA polymerase sigma factor [Schumannella soli]|uniref:sigma-70 family RNA polymerase sigma factor n=1 Tax=Schumannella soli TaxID=2590779 RepID=UPI00210475C3|nr:sigma-70 family RNA polymerase sigma factor [Schumannella soli]